MQDQHESTSKAMPQSQPPSDDGLFIRRTPPIKRLIIAPENNKGTVDTIPNEMLEEVFALVVFSAKKKKRAKTAMKLAHVNRRWRSFIMDMPKLWIDVTMTSIGDPDVLDQVLSLHRQKPLDISLYYPAPISGDQAPCFQEMLMVVVRHMTQCRALHIETTASNFHQMRKPFSSCTSTVSNLTHMSLICTDYDHERYPLFPMFNFNPERLPELYLSGVVWLRSPMLSVARQIHIKGRDVVWSGTLRTKDCPREPLKWPRNHRLISMPTALKLDISTLTVLKIEGDQSFAPFLDYFSSLSDTVEILELTRLSARCWRKFIRDGVRFKKVEQLILSLLPFEEIEFITPAYLSKAFPALTHLEIVTPPDFNPSMKFILHYNLLSNAVQSMTQRQSDRSSQESQIRTSRELDIGAAVFMYEIPHNLI